MKAFNLQTDDEKLLESQHQNASRLLGEQSQSQTSENQHDISPPSSQFDNLLGNNYEPLERDTYVNDSFSLLHLF